MKSLKALGMTLAVVGLLAAQVPEDPVLQARSQRGLAENLAEGDLPPVPRGITEPPPLPPPEIHHKDQRSSRVARRRGSRVRVRKQVRARKPVSSRARQAVKRTPKRHK